MAALLVRHKLTPDPGPLQQAASLCLSPPRTARGDVPDVGREYWGYRINGLRLHLEPQRHCRPRAAEVGSLVGVLSVEVQEYVPAVENGVGSSFAHVRVLGASFRCDAHAIFDDDVHTLRSSWHVDTHLHTGTPSNSVHPRFHFQVGEEELDEIDASIRGALMLEAPRPAVAPLDGVLAIDFVLSHYCGAMWDTLRTLEAGYNRIRAPSMARYWSPYFRMIADALQDDGPVPHGSPAGLLIPNLVTT